MSVSKNIGIATLFSLFLFFSPALSARDIISVQGSTTVLPVMQILVESYMDRHPEVSISISGGGSGAGLTSLFDGVIDIAMSSREMKPEEKTGVQERGIEIGELVLAYDAIAVVVNPQNPLEDVSLETLRKLYTGEIRSWQELDWKDLPVLPISRDFASGTFEVFNQIVLQKQDFRPDVLMLVSNLMILNEVSISPDTIGYIGLGYVNDQVKVLRIDGVAPHRENIRSGTYPLKRPLYLYYAQPLDPDVQRFLGFIHSDEGQSIINGEGLMGTGDY